MYKIALHNLDNLLKEVYVNPPETCIHCDKTMLPKLIFAQHAVDNFMPGSSFCVTYQCLCKDCHKYFAVEYILSGGSETDLYPYTYYHQVEVYLPDSVAKLSPNFKTIYKQAKTAEYYNLDQIAGIGYRKAVEFLIKDYASHKCPTDKDKIQRMTLSQVIKSYLDDVPKIQHLATASTWLGNDETHYIRKHTDKDIDDLKTFIEATIHFIAYDLEADGALSFISSK